VLEDVVDCLEDLNATIESLVLAAHSRLELFHVGVVQFIVDTDHHLFLGFVSFVSNDKLAGRDHSLQVLAEDGQIICTATVGSFDPDTISFRHGDTNFILDGGPLVLMGEPGLVPEGRLSNAAVCSIHRKKEDARMVRRKDDL
jgi:hypothetical protein